MGKWPEAEHDAALQSPLGLSDCNSSPGGFVSGSRTNAFELSAHVDDSVRSWSLLGRSIEMQVSLWIIILSVTVAQQGSGPVDLEIDWYQECGSSSKFRISPRAGDGEAAAASEWPWIAAVLHHGRLICGGSLVGERHIVTAARHVYRHRASELTVQFHQVNQTSETFEFLVEQVVLHSGYDVYNELDDIAMLTLKEPVRFSHLIHPVCLSLEDEQSDNEFAYSAEWVGRQSGHELREHVVLILSNEVCRSAFNQLLVETQLCGAMITSGQDSCAGDGGGALMVSTELGRWQLIGLVSQCDRSKTVYTRLVKYLDWIRDRVPGWKKTIATSTARERTLIPQTASSAQELEAREEAPSLPVISATLAERCGFAPWRTGVLTRIVGGRESDEGDWPWMAVLIGKNGTDQFCAGSLINDQFVLTAGHCLSEKAASNITVRLGEHDLRKTSNESVEFKVDRMFVHESYSKRTQRHDVGLIKLLGRVQFTDYIRPICLPPPRFQPNVHQAVYVAGWGTTAFKGHQSQTLRETVLRFVKNDKCRSLLPATVPLYFESQLCAGYLPGGRDACQGDSGGPLMVETAEDTWTVAGVISFGIGCAKADKAGVYTRVSYYLDWIAGMMASAGGRVQHDGSSLTFREAKTSCGHSTPAAFKSRRKRIVGGEVARENQWPWMAALLIGDDVHCGGVLISNQHVLTASQCFLKRNSSDFTIRLGEHDLGRKSGTEADFKIEKAHIHENYDRLKQFNDIAVVRLTNKVQFSANVQPICLPTSMQPLDGVTAYVSGWGTESYRGNYSQVLQHVAVPVWSFVECWSTYEGHPMDGNKICAGYASGGKDSCQGDSGGPLMVETADERWTLVGITSFGRKCAEPHYPGVYTRVDAYWHWIRSKVID